MVDGHSEGVGLLVNATDLVRFNGPDDDQGPAYRCIGLHGFIDRLIKGGHQAALERAERPVVDDYEG